MPHPVDTEVQNICFVAGIIMGNFGSLQTCASNMSCIQLYSSCISVCITLNKVIQDAAARLGKGTQHDRGSNEFVVRKAASSNTFSQRTVNN